MSPDYFTELLGKRNPGDRLKSIFVDLILILVLITIALSCHNILITFKPALINHPAGQIANAILFGVPTALALIICIILMGKWLYTLVLFIADVKIKISSFSKQKKTLEYKNAKEYLMKHYEKDVLQIFKVNKWLFIHHLQGTLKLFNSKTESNRVHHNYSFLESIGYGKVADFFEDNLGERANFISTFIAIQVILILLHCFFVNNIAHDSIFNSINLINLLLLGASALFIFILIFIILKFNENHDIYIYNKIAYKYHNAFKYIYFNDSYWAWATKSEIQLLDYVCKNNGIIVNDPSKRFFHNDAPPMTLEEFKESRYYNGYKGFIENHKDADDIDTIESLNKNDHIASDYRIKLFVKSFLALIMIVILFVSLAAPYRIFQINYNMKIKGAKEQYNKALGLYNNEVIKAKNQPDSVIVNTYRNMVDYNSIGSDWDFTNSFDNTEVPVAKDNYFALEDLDNKKIKINTTIIEDDDTYPDRSYNTFYIKFNKKDLLANDSTMSWSTRQVVKENGKRSTQHYAVWETTYKISLKPKVLPSKPKPIDKEIVQVNGSVLTDRFFSDQFHIPILETSIEDIPNFVADYFDK